MDVLKEARRHREAGRPRDALAAYAQLLGDHPEPQTVAEATDVALGIDAVLAEQLARLTLSLVPEAPIARHQLGEAFARQRRWAEAVIELRAAVATDGRLADLRLADGRPWTHRDPTRRCPACDEAPAELVWVGNATRVQTVFNLLDPVKVWVRCRGCDLVYTPSVPSESALAAYYAAQRGASGLSPPDGRAVVAECLAWEPALVFIEDALGKTGTLLEIGCAWGVFMSAAAWRGFDVHGLELSPSAAVHARETFGLRVDVAQVPDGLPTGPIDAVVMWEVLEHFADPEAILAACAARLGSGGILALSTPDLDHPAHRALGAADPMWSVPGHLVYYSRRTLTSALARAGLTPVRWWFSNRHVGSVGVIARKP